MIIKESNFLNLNNELNNITHWCKDIVRFYTGDESFREDISKFYDALDDSEREDLFKKVEKISTTLHKMYLEIDKIDDEMDEFGFL